MTEWTTLTSSYVKREVKPNLLFLATSAEGQVYVGIVESITERYIELRNGPHREILFYANRPGMRFTMIDAPLGVRFGEADPVLGFGKESPIS